MHKARRRLACWALIFLFLLANHRVLTAKTSSTLQYYQRCRSLSLSQTTTNATTPSSALQGFSSSTCRLCNHNTNTHNSSPKQQSHEDQLYVGVFLTSRHHYTFETTMIMVASLLTSGHRVLLLYQYFERKMEQTILRDLFQLIPCEHHQKAHALLIFQDFPTNPTRFKCKNDSNYYQQEKRNSIPPGDVLACEIQNSVPLVEDLEEKLSKRLEKGKMDLLITDGVFVAGMLVAERFRLPTLALMEGKENLRRILGPLGVSSSSGLLTPLALALQDRLQLLDQSEEYVGLNGVRSKLGLNRLRVLADFWTTKRLLITTHDTSTSRPNLLQMQLPLLPPCVPCKAKATSSNKSIPALIVAVAFPDDAEGRKSSRALMQGIAMARASLQKAYEDSRGDFESKSNWQGPSDFVVVRFDEEIVELQPPYVAQEDLHFFLDSFVRHDPIAGILTRCTGDDLLRSLGPPLLCLDSSWSVKDLARLILKLLVEYRTAAHGNAPSKLSGDGFTWFVSLISQIVEEKKRGAIVDESRTLDPETRAIRALYYGSLETSSHKTVRFASAGILITYLAWILLLGTVTYMMGWMPHLTPSIVGAGRRTSSKEWTLALEEFQRRLPELDNAFVRWQSWFAEELKQVNVVQAPSSRSAKTPSASSEGGHSKGSKRRPHKKRH